MDSPIASAISLLSSGGICYLGYLISKKQGQLQELSAANTYSPSTLFSEVRKSTFLENLEKNPENPQEYLIKAFVEGNAVSSNPIKSKINGKTELIYSHYTKVENRSNDPVQDFTADLTINSPVETQIDAPIYFTLRDARTKHFCLVHRNLEVETVDILDKIAEKKVERRLSTVENVFVQLGRVFALLGLLTKNLISFRGLTVGWTETELGIAVGSPLVTYGEVIYNAAENTLKIDTPLYFLQEKGAVLRKLKNSIVGMYAGICLLMIPFVWSTWYIINKKRAQARIQRLKREEQQRAEILRAKFGDIEDDYKCIVCADRPRDIILKPCMHFSLCKTCYMSLHKHKCPVCNLEVEDTVDIFFS